MQTLYAMTMPAVSTARAIVQDFMAMVLRASMLTNAMEQTTVVQMLGAQTHMAATHVHAMVGMRVPARLALISTNARETKMTALPMQPARISRHGGLAGAILVTVAMAPSATMSMNVPPRPTTVTKTRHALTQWVPSPVRATQVSLVMASLALMMMNAPHPHTTVMHRQLAPTLLGLLLAHATLGTVAAEWIALMSTNALVTPTTVTVMRPAKTPLGHLCAPAIQGTRVTVSLASILMNALPT